MKQQTQKNKIEWREVEIGELLDYEQPGKYIVEGEILKEETKSSVPVLTANKSFILGYTEEKKGIYENPPVIIFDDFTTDTKFVDFRFKVKSSAMKLLRPKSKEVNLKFVFLMMKGIQLNFSTHKRYYLSVYQKRKILMPFKENKLDVEEQEKFVKILENSLKLNEKGKKIEKLLNEYLKNIFYEMFLKEKGKFEIEKLGNICDVRDGTHESPKYVNEGYPLITSKNITKGYIDFSEVNLISKKDFDNVNKRSKVDEGDIIMPMIGTIGKPLIVPKTKEFAIKNVALIKFTKMKINNLYIKFLLDSDYFDFLTFRINRGGTQKFIALKDIRNFEIPLPPLPLQQKFSKIVEQIEKMKDSVNKTKKNSEELFNSLVSKAFRGEL